MNPKPCVTCNGKHNAATTQAQRAEVTSRALAWGKKEGVGMVALFPTKNGGTGFCKTDDERCDRLGVLEYLQVRG